MLEKPSEHMINCVRDFNNMFVVDARVEPFPDHLFREFCDLNYRPDLSLGKQLTTDLLSLEYRLDLNRLPKRDQNVLLYLARKLKYQNFNDDTAEECREAVCGLYVFCGLADDETAEEWCREDVYELD